MEATSTVTSSDGNTDFASPTPTTTCQRLEKAIVAESTIVFLVAAVENLLAIVILGTYKTRSNNTHKLLFLMAVNDFAATSLGIASNFSLTLACRDFTGMFCDVLGLVIFTLFCWSLHIVTVMNVERYLMICQPVYHHNHVNGRFLGLLCGVGFGLIIMVLGLPLVGVGDPYYLYKDNKFCGLDFRPGVTGREHNVILGIAGVFGTLLVTVTFACNVAMMRRLRRGATGPGGGSSNGQQSAHTAKVQKMQAFNRVTLAVAVVNCTLNLPFYLKLFVSIGLQSETIEEPQDVVTTVLWFLTPVINPILYIAFNKNYQRHLLRVRKRLRCRSNKVLAVRESPETVDTETKL